MRRLADRPVVAAASLLFVAAVLLSACAPAAGSQSSVAIPAADGPITAERGQTLYVRLDYTLAGFGLNETDLRPPMWVPSGYASEVGDVTSHFGLHDLRGATGWQIELSRMRLERSTVTSASSGATSTIRDLWAEVRVVVPEDAIAGIYRVRGEIQARGGRTQPATFSIEVR